MLENVYTLRVRLKWAKGVWREIAIRGDQTLAQLHSAILDAFDWQAEDTYQFIMSDDIDNASRLYEPLASSEDRRTDNITLDAFELDEDDQIFYIYGAGDYNQFPIRVISIDDPDPYTDYPDVVDENGESPDQSRAYL